ncbi:MAG: phosphodiester glycosidase family protein, partial [Ruminococcus sp.]|nr:phosphodiester glycosidase family protein [Ruminococcus sp.]
MKHSGLTKTLSVILSLVLIFSTVSMVAGAVGEFTAPEGMYLISNTQSKIAPGVTENKIITNKDDGQSQVQGYAVTVDMSKGSTATLMAGYADYSGDAWKMQTVRNQAKAIERKQGVNVVAGFNADIFNMQTGEPTNILVLDGKVVKEGLGKPYFAIMKDGTAKIGNSMTADVLKDVKEAVGGFYTILENGQKTPSGYSTGNFAPKTAVGIKADGTVVVYVADGRNAPVSVGLHDYDLADIMLGLGCVDCINLDGGGSTTYAVKYEGSDDLVIGNRPSDGIERVVSSSLFIVSSAKPTGEFDHASLTPNNTIYTPNSTVDFSAIGVDSAGGKADLPADGKFVLENNSFGTITADGKFVSSGKTGTVVVNYVSNGAVAGSTAIEVQVPDSIYFDNEEISLGFEKDSTLGLNVRYQNREVIFKDGDIIWSLDDEKMGTFNGNVFTSSDSASIIGKIYAELAFDRSITASITASIGKLPSVVWDFENPEEYNIAHGVFGTPNNTYESDYDANSTSHVVMTYGRGGAGNAEIVTKENGEVRHGTRALKISYDFTNWNGVTEGVCFGPAATSKEIEGTPTALGMWIYAPEGTPNLWLRMYYTDATGSAKQCNLTEQRKEAADGIGGINWSGWRYVEGKIDGVAPFCFSGGGTIRLMYLAPAGNEHGFWTVTGGYEKDANGNDTAILNKKWVNQADAKGYIYVDNVQFVYGANVDDIDNPVIDDVQVGSASDGNMQNIVDGTVVDTNDVCIQSSFHDIQNKYTTDINFDNVNIYLDGKDVTADSIILKGDYMLKYYTTLADGLHSVKILVRDGFNNETTETRYFTVKGGVEYPTVKVVSETEKCMLNNDYTLALVSNDIKQVTGVKTTIKLDNAIVSDASDLKIEFANGFSGNYTYNNG